MSRECSFLDENLVLTLKPGYELQATIDETWPQFHDFVKKLPIIGGLIGVPTPKYSFVGFLKAKKVVPPEVEED